MNRLGHPDRRPAIHRQHPFRWLAVPGKLLDHANTEDRPFDGVVHDVKPDQTRIEITVGNALHRIGSDHRAYLFSIGVIG
jgi:hypothetical protein